MDKATAKSIARKAKKKPSELPSNFDSLSTERAAAIEAALINVVRCEVRKEYAAIQGETVCNPKPKP